MSLLANVKNYYESWVLEAIQEEAEERSNADEDWLIDVACVALNHLPPRYIRHEVDMAFYLSPIEREEMRNKVRDAVLLAIAYVNNNRNRPG